MQKSGRRNGTNQNGRISDKLLPDYFQIDERSLHELLAYTAQYASLLEFVDAREQRDKSWEVFFSRDINVFLARIISLDLDKIDAEFEGALQLAQYSFQSGEKTHYFLDVYGFLYNFGLKFDKWIRESRDMLKTGGRIEDAVEGELRGIIGQKLSTNLKKLRNVAILGEKNLKIKGFGRFRFEEFHDVWRLSDGEDEDFGDPYKGDSINAKLNNGLIELKFIFLNFFDSLAYMNTRFQRHFSKGLESKDNHAGHVGLLIAFLKLRKYAQSDLNKLTSRHLQFYYQYILNQTAKPPIPDEVHLCLELSSNKWKYNLEEGTRFTAGYDDNGEEILFESTEDVELNRTKIQSLRTVFISQILENQIGTYKLVTGLHAAPMANSSDGRGKSFEYVGEDWPLFGEEQYKSGISTMGSADIGFAFASPIFFLAEGNRRVNMHLKFTPDSVRIYQKLIEDIAEVKTEGKLRHAFLEIFGKGRNSGFNILLSGPNGWIDVKEEAANEIIIEAPEEDSWNYTGFTISFLIPASAPPVVPIGGSAYGTEKYETSFPVVKLLLNPKRTPFIYSFLETLELASVDFEVEVDRVKSLVVQNDIARLDPTQPFQPFGPQPTQGSYMLLGNTEMFKKSVSEFRLAMEWKNFPRFGLERYYENYFPKNQPKITEDKFKIRLSALSGSEFKPHVKDKDLEFGLFTEEGGFAVTTLEMKQMTKLGIKYNPHLQPVRNFDNATPIGFFKLELIEPAEAFGHELFNEKFMEIAQHNADMNTAPEDRKKTPNTPLTPLAKSIQLSYKAKDHLNLLKAGTNHTIQFFHIHPFGSASIFTEKRGKMDQPLLVPQYRHDAYLYIALQDLRPPQDVSILFELVAGRHTFSHKLPEFSWSYLAENKWEALKDEHLLSDTTDNFTTTGIIRVHIPGKITKRNNLLPSGVHWLRVAVKGDPENVSRALEVRSQVVKAVWVDNGLPERLRSALPPGSIKALYTPVAAVREVHQPYPSFNGQSEESQNEYFSRVSERLRHKGRAVNHWDYERMTLEKFHTIFQAKASSHISDPNFVEKGNIRLVVVPRLNHGTDELNPKVNHNTLLRIAAYLRQNVSPFVKLHVSNPVFEYIRVVCSVKFEEGKNNGHSLERMKKDIREFMCPWLIDADKELELGGSVQVSALLNFVKSLPHVKFVTRFALLHFYLEDEESGIYRYLHTANTRLDRDQRETIQSTLPWSVIVPDDDHEIEIIQKEREIRPEFKSHPVDFQGKFQVSPQKHIRRIYKDYDSSRNVNTGYKVNDTLKIFVDDSVSSS